jgi:putative ABC transport system ATP-binding protein
VCTNPALILADEPTGNLDSRSSAEVMSLFTSFHEQGRTVVMITHEPEIAEYASRVVILRDGVIVSDQPQDSSRAVSYELEPSGRYSFGDGAGVH